VVARVTDSRRFCTSVTGVWIGTITYA
jgi:hypothetical protein